MAAKRFGPGSGSSSAGPLRVRRTDGLPSQRGTGALANVQEFEAKIVGAYGYRTRHHSYNDFNEAPRTYVLDIPLFDNVSEANESIVTNTKTARGSRMIPRGATLIGVQLTAEDALATSDTNYITFDITNNGPAGAGTAAMLLATDASTTKATGGVAIAAEIGRSFTVNATAANLVVAAGDLVTVTGTVTGTLANEVQNPVMRLTFQTIPLVLTPRVTRTAGSPGINYRDDIAGGWLRALCEATSEAQFVGLDFGDQRTFQANRSWEFEAYVNLPATIADNEIFFCGVVSDYNATLGNIATRACFRIIGAATANLTLVINTDDATTDSSTTTTKSLTAGTAVWLRICSKPNGTVEYWVDDDLIGTHTATFLTTTLQPLFGVGKASGTTVPAADIDVYYLDADRF